MVKIYIFGKTDCAKCKTTKNKLKHFLGHWEMARKVELVFHDMETVDGRAEGAFHDVDQIPATIVETNGRSVARWDGQVPNSKAVRLVLQESVGSGV
jgi:thioredoxin-like negative regulator of GroEL